MNPLLAYDGEFGFTATLTINMESKNTGLYANMFYYNEQTGKLKFYSLSGCCPSCANHLHSVISIFVKVALNEESSGLHA